MRAFNPPGAAEAVVARSAVVLAPHYDDEVLGCGALLAQLVQSGARVEVVFLTDGSGGAEGAPEASDGEDAGGAYASRRRAEATRATGVLGVRHVRHLDYRDGGLEDALEPLTEAVDAVLRELEPDLVLVPSPLEVTGDHRAAFAAVHGALHGRRDAQQLTVLAYEVNHPLYPNLLVDASEQVDLLGRAMGEYASQQERHDYLAAAVGLRRFRTHSLSPDVEAAEAYYRLESSDLRTLSLAATTTRMGGQPQRLEVQGGEIVSVVVRTKDRPALLADALTSLAESEYRRLEVVLVNDGGSAPEVAPDYPFDLRRVDLQPGRGRSGAAQAGLEAASGAFVAFLDDDDLVFPEHYRTLVGAVGGGARAAYTDAAIGVYELTGDGWSEVERRLPYSRDYDPAILLVDNYIPFNTVLVEREVALAAGPFDPSFDMLEDWDWLIRVAAQTPLHHLATATCEYRHFRGSGHHALGADAQVTETLEAAKARVLEKHRDRITPATLASAATALRAEAVHAQEAFRASDTEARALSRELHALERAHHALYGEAEALREELARLVAVRDEHQAELARLFAEEKSLRGVAAEHEDHLARTYAEIERLNGVIGAMQQTRAWRLHQLLNRSS